MRSWAAYRRILQHSKLPILVGPWRGEVGFEILYWIPFVKRLAKELNIDPERLIPVTRGGADALYGMATGIELYDLRTPQEVRVENRVEHAKYQMLKQTHWTAFDRAVINDAAKARGLSYYLTLHPHWLFSQVGPFFEGGISLKQLEARALFEPLTVPTLPDGVMLPDRFVAVRFYFRYTFPYHPSLIAFAQESIKQIASHTPVVLLNSDVHSDEHIDISMKPLPPNVYRLTDLCKVTPQNNLAVQAAVMGRALGFVGTYGGLAQLALRLGKPSVSYYHEWGGTSMAHKHLADAIALQCGLPCLVFKVGELPLMHAVSPKVAIDIPAAGASS